MEFLPTESGTWATPSEVIVAADPFVREIVTPKLLSDHLSKFFLVNDVSLRPNVTKSLGVRSLNTSDLVLLLECICASEGSLCQNDLGIEWTSKWMFLFYQTWRQESAQHIPAGFVGHGFVEQPLMLPEALAKRLSKVAFLPLQDKSWGALAHGRIFFPPQQSTGSSFSRECKNSFEVRKHCRMKTREIL